MACGSGDVDVEPAVTGQTMRRKPCAFGEQFDRILAQNDAEGHIGFDDQSIGMDERKIPPDSSRFHR